LLQPLTPVYVKELTTRLGAVALRAAGARRPGAAVICPCVHEHHADRPEGAEVHRRHRVGVHLDLHGICELALHVQGEQMGDQADPTAETSVFTST